MRGWKPLTERFEQLAKTYDKPILFTEVGYKNTRGTTIRPWEWPRRMDQSVIDETEQVNAYEALFMTFGNRPWVRGFFMWKWFPDATRITPERVEFSPQNKAAAEALKKWYGFTG
jgi:hypothetical protein